MGPRPWPLEPQRKFARRSPLSGPVVSERRECVHLDLLHRHDPVPVHLQLTDTFGELLHEGADICPGPADKLGPPVFQMIRDMNNVVHLHTPIPDSGEIQWQNHLAADRRINNTLWKRCRSQVPPEVNCLSLRCETTSRLRQYL
jgi:hypothetical protein